MECTPGNSPTGSHGRLEGGFCDMSETGPVGVVLLAGERGLKTGVVPREHGSVIGLGLMGSQNCIKGDLIDQTAQPRHTPESSWHAGDRWQTRV